LAFHECLARAATTTSPLGAKVIARFDWRDGSLRSHTGGSECGGKVEMRGVSAGDIDPSQFHAFSREMARWPEAPNPKSPT